MQEIRLKLVPIEFLQPHEEIKEEDVSDLANQVRSAGVIRNPLPTFETDGHYIVLDGHHRMEALKRLRHGLVPVQIVPREHIQLSHWYHVFDDRWSPPEQMDTNQGRLIGTFQTANGLKNLHAAQLNGSPFIEEVWDFYRNYAVHGFTRTHHVKATDHWVQYGGITFEDVLDVVRSGLTLPPGITRFHIYYRVLNLNVPLDVLHSGDLESWNFLCRQAAMGRVYNEPVVCVEP